METEILLIPLINGGSLGVKSTSLRENVEKTIGRAGNRVDISYNSKVISRKHAILLLKNQKIYIKDAGSSSGTFVNLKRLSAIGKESEFYELKDEDVIQLGESYQQNEVTHQCVQFKFYSKLTTEESLSPEVLESIDNEFELNCKILDEKSDMASIFNGRGAKKTGSLWKVSIEEFRSIQLKYGLDPLINDTDMALFMMVESLLEGYSDMQRVTVERLKASTGSKDPNTGFFRRKSEMSILGIPSVTMQRQPQKAEKIDEDHPQYGNLNLSSIF